VRSVIGRYLEHSRIFTFHNGGDTHTYIGSADMMHRNLDRRIEALVRLADPHHVKELEDFFDMGMSNDYATWALEASGEWVRRSVDENGRRLPELHDELMRRIQARPMRHALR
jgi:polyphosphate kinase